MKDRKFYLNWLSFALGLVLGVFGFACTLFARTDRRDKIYSSLLGWFLGVAITLVIWKMTGLPTLSL